MLQQNLVKWLQHIQKVCWKKKKHAQGVIVTVQNTFIYIPSYKNINMLAFRETCWFSGKNKILQRMKQQLQKIAFFFSQRTTKKVPPPFFSPLNYQRNITNTYRYKSSIERYRFSPTRNKETKCGHMVKLQCIFTFVQHIYKKNTI